MSLAHTHTAPEYDDAGARKALAKCTKAHQAKVAERDELRQAIIDAEAKLLAMQEAIDKSAAPSKMRLPKPLRMRCGEAPMFPSAPTPGVTRQNAMS